MNLKHNIIQSKLPREMKNRKKKTKQSKDLETR